MDYAKQSLKLIETATKLLTDKTVDAVLGLKENSEAGWPTTYFARTSEDAKNLVWNEACYTNLAFYLVEAKGKVAIAAKACDVRSIINLLAEYQLKRENFIIIGMECSGKMKDGKLASGCDACPSSIPNMYDIVIAADGTETYKNLEMASSGENVTEWAKTTTVDERFERLMKEVDKCILCYACRQACQGCYCVSCFMDRKATPWEQVDADTSTKLAFHLTRAMHLAGRCTDCGACEKVCPSGVNLKYIYKGLGEFVDDTYDFKAGVDPEATPVMNQYTVNDQQVAFLGVTALSAYKMDMSQARAALAKLMEKYTVIAPVMAGDKLDYAEVSNVNDVILDNRLPYKSPKEIVFPRVENVMRFLENRVEEAQDIKPVLLVGAKPCDIEALKVFDEVFTSEKGKYQDSFYMNRRDLLIVVGMGCLSMKTGCFCDKRGIDFTFSPDCDGFLNLVDGELVYEPLTEKGKGLFDGDKVEAIKRTEKIDEKLYIKATEAEVFTTMPWETYAEGCIGCGTCTYLCPTCHCFNLRDADDKAIITRTRVWDSCMYPKFTLHAGGHNPRTKKPERFRQRVLHKYLYIPENYGYTACSGCGRCVRACPGGLNIKNSVTDIMKRLEEAKK